MTTKIVSWASESVSVMALAACNQVPSKSTAALRQSQNAVVETAYPERAYFGDTPVHTGSSADAGVDGAVTSPENAFRLASGSGIKSNSRRRVKLDCPLDWMVSHIRPCSGIAELSSATAGPRAPHIAHEQDESLGYRYF